MFARSQVCYTSRVKTSTELTLTRNGHSQVLRYLHVILISRRFRSVITINLRGYYLAWGNHLYSPEQYGDSILR
jgi:hypothetical protein